MKKPWQKKALENSWAQIFATEIFPVIDEERFSILYSNKASRPNAPVNIVIGALIINELFDYSDDEIVENLMLDLHLQYALHTTSFAEQTVVENDKRRLRTKEDGTMNSSALQTPSDPDATYRNKARKLHRGYTANLEETVEKKWFCCNELSV